MLTAVPSLLHILEFLIQERPVPVGSPTDAAACPQDDLASLLDDAPICLIHHQILARGRHRRGDAIPLADHPIDYRIAHADSPLSAMIARSPSRASASSGSLGQVAYAVCQSVEKSSTPSPA